MILCSKPQKMYSSKGSSEEFFREHQFHLCSPDYPTSVEISLGHFYSFNVGFLGL
uniref:Uncharacterized protein n=1 Tax=Arundo donax TaxID=35708 RepID=A0A0A9CZB1_ARUDO